MIENTPVLSMSQQFTILSAIEDLETVTPRVYSQCEECFRSALIEYHSSERASSPTRTHRIHVSYRRRAIWQQGTGQSSPETSFVEATALNVT